MNKPFIVDYKQRNSSKLIFPSPPLLASKRSGNLQVHQYQLAPHEAPRHSPVQDVIVTYSESRPLFLRRELGGTIKDDSSKCGDIMISPAGIFHSACWDRSISITLLALDPQYISRFAFEHIDPDCIELLPHFSKSDPVIHAISQELIRRLDDPLYIDFATSHLAIHLLRNYCSVKHRLKENIYALSPYDLQKVIDYIETHIGRKGLGSTELSGLLGMSRSHFGRLFKTSTGICPTQYIIERRLKKATLLLADKNLSLQEIAQRTGFSHQSHFSSAFIKSLHLTPAQYRKML